MKLTFKPLVLTFFAAVALLTGAPSPARISQTHSTPPAASSKNTSPSSQDIADAKSKGMVWVNTNTRVYHKSDSSLYGTTKRGKFMSEDDAKKAGFRAANESAAAKKQTKTAGTK